ncbi:hypothetical protein JW592_06135 [Streptomyces sp. DW4-2]|uniref:Phosphotransferase n=1 Tax=Streptomyces spirodelae TaxID=2812904 RepID=A0ABS3WPV4_9ACTN|nr:hypothetical protein [Streptomyces spirodelae]
MTSTSTGHTHLGTHPGPCPVDDGLVRRMIGGQFPQWTGAAIARRRSGGTVNAVYRLGEDKAVRLPLTRGGADDVPTEREWLSRLVPLLPTRIPELLGAGEPARCPRG